MNEIHFYQVPLEEETMRELKKRTRKNQTKEALTEAVREYLKRHSNNQGKGG